MGPGVYSCLLSVRSLRMSLEGPGLYPACRLHQHDGPRSFPATSPKGSSPSGAWAPVRAPRLLRADMALK